MPIKNENWRGQRSSPVNDSKIYRAFAFYMTNQEPCIAPQNNHELSLSPASGVSSEQAEFVPLLPPIEMRIYIVNTVLILTHLCNELIIPLQYLLH